MVLHGRQRTENLSTGNAPGPVRMGDVQVPAKVAWILDGVKGSPSARIEFEVRNGQPVCTSVHLAASATGRGIKTGDLATLPALDALAVGTLDDLAMPVPDGHQDSTAPADWFFGTRDHAGHVAARRAIRTAPRLAEVEQAATVYRENIDGAPTEAVADALGVSRRTAARRINEARDRGLLPATTQGKRRA